MAGGTGIFRPELPWDDFGRKQYEVRHRYTNSLSRGGEPAAVRSSRSRYNDYATSSNAGVVKAKRGQV